MRLGLNSSVQTVSSKNQNDRSFQERQPLPLSEAAKQLLENSPSVEKAVKKEEKEDEYLDIPSFVRTQLD